MRYIRWSPEAYADLENICRHISRDNPTAAMRVSERILNGCESLGSFSDRGRIGELPGTRELVFAPLPYIAVYRVKNDIVEIVRIWHGAQSRN